MSPWRLNGVWRMRDLPDAIVLCGGAGLRLRSVTGDKPKVMAAVSGGPFLEVLLRQLLRYGFKRVILAVGYKAEVIETYFGSEFHGLALTYSKETSPLGTGGAMLRAVELAASETVLVMNGDSYTGADLGQFVSEHQSGKPAVSVLVVPVDGRDDCGTVVVNCDGRITQFAEKQANADAGYVNAGIYLVSRQALSGLPDGCELSLERDVFPRWFREGRDIRAFVCPSRCVDIGTPERYQGAQITLDGAEGERFEMGREA